MFSSKPRTALLSALTAATLAVLFAFALAVPAASAQSDTPFGRMQNIHWGTCLSENGTTALVGLSDCNTNHSEYWAFSNPIPITVDGTQTSAFELRNAHSNLCLDEYGHSVSADTCHQYHQQYWFLQPKGSIGGSDWVIENLHYGLCLWAGGATGPFVGASTCPTSINGAAIWDLG